MVSPAIAVAGVAALCVLLWLYDKLTAPGFRVAGKHVFITGGSTGLGLAIAKKYARAGAKVSIVARDIEKLAAAKREIESSTSSDVVSHRVFAQSCDVTDFAAVQRAVADANALHDRVTDHVVCNAGTNDMGLLLDHDVSVFRSIMDLNYFGALHTVKAALPHMVATPLEDDEPKRRVIFINSAAGLTTFVGYSQYSSSKYAMRGLNHALRNELLLYDIETSTYFPGNIDTPLLYKPMPKKPEATKRIDRASVPVPVDAAAQSLIDGLARGRYAITNEVQFEMLRVLANGVAPRSHALLEALLLPLFVVVQTANLWYFDWVVQSEAKKHRNTVKVATYDAC